MPDETSSQQPAQPKQQAQSQPKENLASNAQSPQVTPNRTTKAQHSNICSDVAQTVTMVAKLRSTPLAVFCVVLFAFSLALSVMITTDSKSVAPTVVRHSKRVRKAASDQSLQENIFDMFRETSIETRLAEVSEESALRDPSTPQGKAFKWIVEEDGMELHPDAPNLVQRYVLAVLFFASNGNNWHYVKNHWLKGVHECEWYEATPGGFPGSRRSLRAHKLGVLECDRKKNVRQLVLSDNNISGELPHEIGFLPFLEVLELRDNRIQGEIPPSIGKLESLKELGLNGNKISGTIPYEVGHLEKLDRLHLHFTELSGGVPFVLCLHKYDNPHLEIRADCGRGGMVACSCCNYCCNGVNTCAKRYDALY